MAKHRVNVDRRQPGRIAKHGLGQRQLEVMVGYQSDVARAYLKFAHQVRDALQAVASAHADNMCAEGALVHQLHVP